MKKINVNLYLECLILSLLLIPISSATVIDFQETYQDYNGNSHKYNGQNLGDYPLYSVTDNNDNYTISRFNISKDLPKQYARNGITFNISYQFYPDRIVPSFQIDSYSQINDFVVKQNATAWYLPFPWKASQYISFTDDLIDMGVFKRTTKVTVLDSNGTEYQVLPKVSNQIRLWFNPQTYSNVVYPLTITENTITVNNATTSGFTSANVTFDGVRWTDSGQIAINLRNDSQLNMSGLVGYWSMDENTGTFVHQVNTESGLINSTNQGTWNGNTTLNYSSGQIGNALDFDGVNDYVDAGSDTSLNITNTITIGAWIKLNNLTGTQVIIGKSYSTVVEPYWGYALQTYTTSVRFALGINSGLITLDRGTLTKGDWYHIVGMYDGSNMKIYVNGIQQGTSQVQTGNISINTVNVNIGRFLADNSDYFNGTIDEVRIYNRALSASEITVLYNTSMRTQGNLTILNQSASAGNVINRTRIVYTRQDSINNASIYARQNGTSTWNLIQSNATSNTWYSITNQYQSMDFDVRLNGNGSNTPFFTSLEWDESSNISSITNLTYTSTTSSINWTWTNPTDVNFGSVMIYIDGEWIRNVTDNYYLRYYEADRYHTMSTHTVSTIGVVNDTWVNSTGHTLVPSGGAIGSGGSSGGGVWNPEKPKYYTPDTNVSNSSNKVTKIAANQVQESVSNVVDVVNQNGTNIIIFGIIVLAVIVGFIKYNKPYKFNKKR